ncbi:P-II family nitrogen regulator [Bacillaceae bacterium W0354]
MPVLMTGHKLIVTIVKKDKAKKVIHASKLAGAQGGTTFFGKGFRHNEKTKVLGIPVEREREIVLTLVSNSIYPQVLDAIIDSVKLNKAKHGIGFVIDTKKITGVNHMLGLGLEENENSHEGVKNSMVDKNVDYDLIITIVNRGDSDKVVESTRKAGAEGGTIINGRGTGVHEKAKLFNILIEPEKEIVLTLIDKQKTEEVLKAIEEGAELNKAGKGIAFVLDVEETVGINHILNRYLNEKYNEIKDNE